MFFFFFGGGGGPEPEIHQRSNQDEALQTEKLRDTRRSESWQQFSISLRHAGNSTSNLALKERKRKKERKTSQAFCRFQYLAVLQFYYYDELVTWTNY